MGNTCTSNGYYSFWINNYVLFYVSAVCMSYIKMIKGGSNEWRSSYLIDVYGRGTFPNVLEQGPSCRENALLFYKEG